MKIVSFVKTLPRSIVIVTGACAIAFIFLSGFKLDILTISFLLIDVIIGILLVRKLKDYKVSPYYGELLYLMLYFSAYMALILIHSIWRDIHLNKAVFNMVVLLIEVIILIVINRRYKSENYHAIFISITFSNILICMLMLFLVSIFCIDFKRANIVPILIDMFLLILLVVSLSFSKLRKEIFFQNVSQDTKELVLKMLGATLTIIFWLAALATFMNWDSDQKWISILMSAVVMLIISIYFSNRIKKLEFGMIILGYFLVVSIFPIIIFIAFLFRDKIGTYTVFILMLGSIGLITGVGMIALGSTDITDWLITKKDLRINKSKLAEYKIIVKNTALLATFITTLFANKNTVIKLCNTFAKLCGKVDLVQIPSKVSESLNFKLSIFIMLSAAIILSGGYLLLQLEKYVFLKVAGISKEDIKEEH